MMKNIVRNLLPADTRWLELTSSICLLTISILMLYNLLPMPSLALQQHPYIFWMIISFLFGVIQFFSLIKYPDYEIPRIFSAWLTGTFWVLMSVISDGVYSLGAVAIFWLGIGNLISFVLNIIILSEQWKR